MPTLRQFARRIRVLADGIPDRANELKIRTALAINQTVIFATPVDTGRARANWQVGVDFSIQEVREAEDILGERTLSEAESRARSARLGQDIIIVNNVDYITFLNQGSSAQAPAGFVEMAILEGSRVAAQGLFRGL